MPEFPLYHFLKDASYKDSEEVMSCFLEYVSAQGIELYPAQEEAILELYDNKNVILNTPTGSGKSLVAAALHFKSICAGRRSVYTCPIKALVNEKFLALCREFGPDNVGMVTGDATINRKAPILCCTAEILSNIALQHGENAEFHDIIIDEFHYYSDRERGVAWQVPLLTLSKSRFLLMSATLGSTDFFETELTRLNGLKTAVVKSATRPVPLEFSYSEVALEHAVEELMTQDKAPVYIVHPSQREAAETAQKLTSINFCSKEEKGEIADALVGTKFSSPYGNDVKKYLRHGIGLHHAGLLPKYRVLVEQLAQRGLLKVICGTDTLGVGVNVPIRTVLLTKLCRFDGEKTVIYPARDFHQICGRAGRKGFDDIGWVVAQAPEHVIENLKMERKAADDPKKKKKLVKRKPPENRFVSWDDATFQKLMAAEPEPLVSRFDVSHGMILNVLSRPGDGCRAMRKLIDDCHESDDTKRKLRRKAFQLFRSMIDKQVVEFVKPGEATTSKVRVNVELQEDFSLNQTLSLYLLDTLPKLDANSPDYALDLLSLVEAILEDPDLILRRQLDKVKDRKMAEMKAEGIEYDERMEELEKLEYPKPNREFIYSTFNEFAAHHPWVGQENIRPKSIAREMFENFQTFANYIKDYSLQRVEGLLLRHLHSVYKVLVQTVPTNIKTDEIDAIILYFGDMLRQVDSSLLDEWKRLRDPNYVPDEKEEAKESGIEGVFDSNDITRDRRAFEILIRNEVFKFVRALAFGNLTDAVELISHEKNDTDIPAWTEESFQQRLDEYHQEHGQIRVDPDARNKRNTTIKPVDKDNVWTVEQRLLDPENHNDWFLTFSLDVDESRTAGKPVIRFTNFGSPI